ncbi:MAG TPA: CbiX/SirB N-terminal domain-containing protein [Magnetospirillum sp.]|jgi:sirohydrochlorin cobaltochelatase|nr:CbiX/SirB N-terminal domain-containing protein [Magnetospirillum sp.]
MSAAILLVGHGSARHPDSATPIHALAEALRRRGPWSEVAAAFMKQGPHLSEALSLVSADEVVIVPVFAGKGYYTDVLIPREMGLDGPVTRKNGRILHLTQPAGCDPRIPGLMARRADAVACSAGLDPTRTSLLLIAHGSGRPGGAGETPKAIATAIAAMDHFAEVRLAFLEQEPFARDWQSLVQDRGEVVVLPLLVAQGTHASQDIPPLFNLSPGQSGPVAIGSRTIRLASSLGAEPELVDIVATMVERALGR